MFTVNCWQVITMHESWQWLMHTLFVMFTPHVNPDLIVIKTHGSVSCGVRIQVMRKQSVYIDRNNKVAIFTHRDALSKWHQIYCGVSLHSEEARFQILIRSFKLFLSMSQQNFVKISSFSSSFRTLCVNRYNSHMHASIWLKFVTRIGRSKYECSNPYAYISRTYMGWPIWVCLNGLPIRCPVCIWGAHMPYGSTVDCINTPPKHA